MRAYLKVMGVFAVLALTGCASAPDRPVPTRQIQAAEAAILKAEQAGASSLETRIAREKLAGARRAVEDEHLLLAERSAIQAEADARLALARAEADRARAASVAAQQSLPPVPSSAE